jgi:hypothetical protein
MLAFIGRTLFLASGSLLGLLALLYQPQANPDHEGYYACIQLHPQKYCGITYLGNR